MSLILEQIRKNQVTEFVENVEVFMLPCNLNPYKDVSKRFYVNREGCKSRSDVNKMYLDFTKYTCVDQQSGLHPNFFAEYELRQEGL